MFDGKTWELDGLAFGLWVVLLFLFKTLEPGMLDSVKWKFIDSCLNNTSAVQPIAALAFLCL